MNKLWKIILGVAFLVGSLAWAPAPNGFAAKPAPTPPAPPGTIYFQYGTATWRMNGDGSGKQLDHPNSIGLVSRGGEWEPSSLLYEGSRWWVTYGSLDGTDVEVFAYRPYVQPDNSIGIELVQVTAGLTIPPEIGWVGVGPARWSNDGQDSYIALVLTDADGGQRLYRINVSGRDLDLLGSGLLPAGLNDLDLLHTADSETALWGFALSPPDTNGETWVAYPRNVSAINGEPALVVANLSVGAETEILNEGAAGLDWSPDGAKIAFRNGDSIATVNPDGSGFTRIVLGPVKKKNTTIRYRQPRFSPNGQGVALGEINDVGWSPQSDFAVDRVATGGGSLVDLTANLSASLRMLVVGWRGHGEAFP